MENINEISSGQKRDDLQKANDKNSEDSFDKTEETIQRIKELSSEEICTILDFIGEERARKCVINYGKKQPPTSDYHIGKKFNGNFWKGFRIEKFPMIKIKNFFIDEIKNDNSYIEHELLKLIFSTLSLKKRKILDQELKEKIRTIKNSEVAALLLRLFNLSLSISYESHQKEIEELRKKYLDKIDELEEKYKGEISDLKDKQKKKIDLLKEQVSSLKSENADLKQDNSEIAQYSSFKSKILSRNNNEEIIEQFFSLWEENKINNKDDMVSLLEEMFNKNISKLHAEEDVSNLIIAEYLLFNMIEEK